MDYEYFEQLLSRPRLQRYLDAVCQDKEKALLLYAYNIQLSQQLFAVIAMFEVILRNKINQCIQTYSGINHWLHQAIQKGGMFDNVDCEYCKNCIIEAMNKLQKRKENATSHDKLLAELHFGFWRYMFESAQFKATGQSLLKIAPKRPKTTTHTQHYNQKWFAKELKKINELRNRIAHHETICMYKKGAKTSISTLKTEKAYQTILNLLNYMNIDSNELLKYLNIDSKNIFEICNHINALKPFQAA
ncbi:MAG: Abi family protein [Neisseriaceae bacterium]|nr:Abi family protein [Neisseriaceae bacterium]